MHYCLKDITAQVHIGITADERSTPQTLLFEVSFDFDAGKASQTDDLADTVDYQVIYDAIKGLDGKWNLLESLHSELLKKIKTTAPEAQNLVLKITKKPWEDGSVTVA